MRHTLTPPLGMARETNTTHDPKKYGNWWTPKSTGVTSILEMQEHLQIKLGKSIHENYQKFTWWILKHEKKLGKKSFWYFHCNISRKVGLLPYIKLHHNISSTKACSNGISNQRQVDTLIL